MRQRRFNVGKAAIGVLLALSSMSASATLLFYEGFDYPPGSLAGQDGGIGFTSAWNTGTVVSNGLSYTDANNDTLVVSGRAYGASSGTRFRSISNALSDATSGTFWMTFLLRPDAAGSGLYGGLSLFDGSTENLFIGDVVSGTVNSNRYRLQSYSPTSSAATSSQTQTNWAPDQTDFIAVRLDLSASNESDNIYMWVNPLLGTEPDISAALLSRTNRNARATRIRLGHNFAVTMDELRFGTTWSDVAPIPEPGTFWLIALSMGGTLVWRRRRMTPGSKPNA